MSQVTRQDDPDEVPLGIVIPTYSHFDYAEIAVETALRSCHNRARVVVVDDCSPDHNEGLAILRRFSSDSKTKHRFSTAWYQDHGGLLRSWNHGLEFFRDIGARVVCVTNSDVIFAPGWEEPIFDALKTYDLVGPVTNAPGTEELQYVAQYSQEYDRTRGDDPEHIQDVQYALRKRWQDRVLKATLNGFCMVARTRTWWANSYDDEHVFRPHNPVNSKGQKNPTPHDTLGEYELQKRWHDAGMKSGVVPGSYVFHYRSISRGSKFRRGDWTTRTSSGSHS